MTALARRSPAATYAVAGEDGQQRLDALMLERGMESVPSPRQASVLLVVGSVPARAAVSLGRLHDQMPHPRLAVAWGECSGALAGRDVVQVKAHAEIDPPDVVRQLQRLQDDLITGRRPSSAPWLPDEPPTPWRGRGDHGQGGEGMMGGTPYGRPMTMTDDDLRDGLSLDAYPVTVGPFAPMLPAGMELTFTLQGDVIQEVEIVDPPFENRSVLEPFEATLHAPGSPVRLERLRAAHHLACVARLLQVRGMAFAARRLLREASCLRNATAGARQSAGAPRRTAPDAVRLRTLIRRLRRSGLLGGIETGLGMLPGETAGALGGPAGRAAGHRHDVRSELTLYRQAGFQPLIHHDGDVRCRLRQWLDEAAQALDLAERLTDAPITLQMVETPSGPAAADTAPPPSAPGDRDLRNLLAGLEWGQAMTVLASFDVNTLHRMLTGGTR